jgi:hypothetical protein
MKTNKFLTLSALFLLLLSTFTVMRRSYVTAQPPEAKLTGTIFDRGAVANGNGLYDYLEVDVEINVTVAGNFLVTASGLVDQFYSSISVYNSSQGFLNTGIQYLNVSFFGPAIFGSRLNPQKVGSIYLETGDYNYLDSIYDVVLSRVYNYTEFNPHAFLTGHVSDGGVDTDGDGLFNYLQVGIEFNVTQTGKYQVSAEGLIEKTGTVTKNYFYDYQYEEGNFTAGIHAVYMNFSGSGIASQRLNPTDVNYIQVYDITNQVQISWLDAAPLSMRYNYTLFNAPSQDIQVNFKVYPDATVAVDGGLNFTHMYPENTYGPQINATMGFSTTGNVTTETSNGTMVFPENQYSNYNAIEAHLRSVYENGLENDTANASMILTPEEAGYYPFNTTDVNLSAAYSGGLFDVLITGQTVIPTAYSTVFPFNMSDATVRIDFDGTKLGGNITFHSIPGFPLADVTVYFSGNRSSLHFTGDVNVTYSSFDDFQVNETTLDQTLADLTGNVTGQGPSSLYNVTGGYLECTNVDVTKTRWSDPTLGADVTYDATVIGNFTGALARMMFPPGSPSDQLQQFAYASLESAASSVRKASLVLTYYHSLQMAQVDLHLACDVQALCNSLLAFAPPAIPSSWSSEEKQIEAMLKVANATAYALTDAGVNASYSSAERKMSLNAWLLANDSQLKNDLIDILPDLGPLDMHDLLASYYNTTYSLVNSSTSTFDMVNGTATFASQVTLQGDFEAQLNHEKALLIAVINSTLPSSLPPTWELQVLNETEININNFRAEFELGPDWMYANFSGLILKPEPDSVDTITFKLKTWLDMMAGPNAPPVDFEKLTITVTGASNANQTVLLSQPPDVPTPDYFSADGKTMAWNNASLSSLKDLTFLIAYQTQISYNARTYDIPILTNSTVTSLVFDPDAKQITFNVTGSPGTGFCNVTIPKNLLNATAVSDWTVTFDGNPLTSGEFNITENAEYVFVYLNYTHSEHVISISGTWVVAEFQPDILPLALIIPIIIAAIIAVKQRRKLEPLKAKCRQTLARARFSLKPS